MCRKLFFSISVVLVLSLASNASAGLIAYWPFDSDYSSIVNNAAYQGTPVGTGVSITNTPGEYKIGTGALKIDDDPNDTIANYVDITNSVLPASPIQISVSLWFKYEDISGDGSTSRNFLYESYRRDANTGLITGDYSISLGIRDDTDTSLSGPPKRAQYYYQTATVDGINNGYRPTETGITSPVDDGQWHHIVNIWDRVTGELEFWLDGVQTVYLNPISDLNPTGPAVTDDLRNLLNGYPQTGLRIGNPRAGDGTRNWDGYIDDVAVFSGHLSDADIAYLYNGGVGPPLIPWWESLFLLAPNGGEELMAGTTYTISWESWCVNDVLVEYSTDDGSSWTEVDPPHTSNSESYNWLVPSVNSNQCLIRIGSATDCCGYLSDTSDEPFTIFVCQGPLVGDIDEDCYVDLLDFAVIGEQWFQSPGEPSADIAPEDSGDDVVDFLDLGLVIGDWLQCGNPFDSSCGI